MPDTMTSRECAESLGVSLDWFYEHRDELIARDGMPASTTSIGRYRPDRKRWTAWRERRDAGRFSLAPANDEQPPPEPRGDAAWSDFLAKVYP